MRLARSITWVTATASLLVACSPRAADSPASSAPTDDARAAGAPAATSDLNPDEVAHARALVGQMADRPKCNKISGCPAALSLARYGKRLVPFILETVALNRRTDGYWMIKLIELSGQLDDERALPMLHALLRDRRWEIPIRAAQALGRLGRAESLPQLQAALSQATRTGNEAFAAALRFALSRVDRGNVAAHRKALASMLPANEEELGKVPAVIIDVTIEMVREARVSAALPAVRLSAGHTNRFVRSQALLTLGALQDTGGIPQALRRLDDPLPSIRRKAVSALQQITGIRTMSDHKQWRQWAQRNGFGAQ